MLINRLLIFVFLIFFNLKSSDVAPKGAIVESAFIIQNKYNGIKEIFQNLTHRTRVSKLLEEQLINKKNRLSNNVKNKRKYQESIANKATQLKKIVMQTEIDTNICQLSKVLSQLYHNKILENFYDQFKDEILSILSNVRKDFENLDLDIIIDIKSLNQRVKKADILLDIVETQYQIFELLRYIDDKELLRGQQICILTSLQQKKDIITNENSKKLKDLNKEIKVFNAMIKKSDSAIIDFLKKLRNSEANLQELNNKLELVSSDAALSIKNSKVFLKTVENLQKKCANLGDLE